MSLQKYQPLAIQKNVRLTRGQKSLYLTVCEKIETGEKLLFQEAHKIYLEDVCRNMRDGKPYSWQYVYRPETKDYITKLLPLEGEKLNFRILTWLTVTLGILILKGYLTVLPAVDLRLLK